MGPVTVNRLIAVFHTADNIFKATRSDLNQVRGIQNAVIDQILSRQTLDPAEKECRFTEEHEIKVLLAGDVDYPYRLKQCPDAPAILYVKGNFGWNHPQVLSIVGTRNATSEGKAICRKIIEELSSENILIVSGMAYGIDITAHKAAVEYQLPTAAVFAHGLDLIYPTAHRKTAMEMLENGGWVSEFRSQTPMDKNYFPRRNRIVAGLCDGVLVIESDRKGGSLITTDIANSYSREVMAVPGRPTNPRSAGCNWLIKTNRAALIENAGDILKLLNWTPATQSAPIQLSVFPSLSENEISLARHLQNSGPVTIDSLADIAGKPMREISHLLLNLELEGIVKALPGKRYRLLRPPAIN